MKPEKIRKKWHVSSYLISRDFPSSPDPLRYSPSSGKSVWSPNIGQWFVSTGDQADPRQERGSTSPLPHGVCRRMSGRRMLYFTVSAAAGIEICGFIILLLAQ